MQQFNSARSPQLAEEGKLSEMDDPSGPPARLAPLSRDAMPASWIASVRAMAASIQALGLFSLYLAAQAGQWPATEPYLFCPALLLSWVLPVLFVVSWGAMSRRQLVLWLLGVALTLTLLAVYDVWRAAGAPRPVVAPQFSSQVLFPSSYFSQAVLLGVGLAQVWRLAAGPMRMDERRARHLVFDANQRAITPYARLFDCATQALSRVAVSLLFVGMVCVVLLLGTGLFLLIGQNLLQMLVTEPWFMFPVIAFAGIWSLHLTEGRLGVIRKLRILLCTVLSWALPLAVCMVGGFGLCLFQTGLEPLWKTGYATPLLLFMALILVVLINASYQDGAVFCVSPLLRWSARVACLWLFPLALLAAVGLGLRVEQYGWSAERVLAALLTALLGACGMGYAWAAIASRPWLGALGAINSSVLWVGWLLLLGICSPLLDPTAMSVRNQLARLASGATSAQAFDFDYLRFEGQRFGQEALAQLAADGESGNGASLDRALSHDWIRQRAAETLRKTQPDFQVDVPSDRGAARGPTANEIPNLALPYSQSNLKMPDVGAAHSRSLTGSRPQSIQAGQSE